MNTPPVFVSDLEASLRQADEIRRPRFDDSSLALVPAADRVAAAVQQAITLRRLERSAGETGFLAMPLDQYLKRLARAAGAEIRDLVFRMRGGDPSARLQPWLSLANRLQLDTTHVRLWVRLWLAEEFRGSPSPDAYAGTVLARRMSYGGGSESAALPHHPATLVETVSPEAADHKMKRWESRYTSDQRKTLNAVLREL